MIEYDKAVNCVVCLSLCAYSCSMLRNSYSTHVSRRSSYSCTQSCNLHGVTCILVLPCSLHRSCEVYKMGFRPGFKLRLSNARTSLQGHAHTPAVASILSTRPPDPRLLAVRSHHVNVGDQMATRAANASSSAAAAASTRDSFRSNCSQRTARRRAESSALLVAAAAAARCTASQASRPARWRPI